MLASVHERDTLELLYVLRTEGYDGTLYFDTFPVREDPAAELLANIAELDRLQTVLDRMDSKAMSAAQNAHDAIAASRALVSA